jgi:MobA/MobL family
MAIFFLNIKTFGRGNGSSAVGAAAYRAGERLHDERTGRTHDHSARTDVLHREILLPRGLDDAAPVWAGDRASLWNAAELAEHRKNARVAREYLVALPAELDAGQRLSLVQGFAHELTDRYRFALDVTLHAPRDYPDSDPRNFHAHLLATTREAGIEGLGAKTALELSDPLRHEHGLPPALQELLHVRERWAMAVNEAMAAAHLAVRVDHRTLQAQGIDREPRPRIPDTAFYMERHGFRSELAERLRSEHAQRQEQRQQAAQPKSLDDIRRQAREEWLKLREGAAPREAAERGRDDDLQR